MSTARTNLSGREMAVGLQEGHDFLVQHCGHCGIEMALDAGDVTFGGEWYHAACWRLAKERLKETGAIVS